MKKYHKQKITDPHAYLKMSKQKHDYYFNFHVDVYTIDFLPEWVQMAACPRSFEQVTRILTNDKNFSMINCWIETFRSGSKNV
jgi:hypothetical protein